MNAPLELSGCNWFDAVQLPHNWMNVSFGSPDLRLCCVAYQELEGCSPLVVTHFLIIKQDCSWVIHIHGHPVDPAAISLLSGIPDNLTHDSATLLLSCLEKLNTCIGNPKPKFISLGETKKKGQFLSVEKEVAYQLPNYIASCVSNSIFFYIR